jgi:hypothetical protein
VSLVCRDHIHTGRVAFKPFYRRSVPSAPIYFGRIVPR